MDFTGTSSAYPDPYAIVPYQTNPYGPFGRTGSPEPPGHPEGFWGNGLPVYGQGFVGGPGGYVQPQAYGQGSYFAPQWEQTIHYESSDEDPTYDDRDPLLNAQDDGRDPLLVIPPDDVEADPTYDHRDDLINDQDDDDDDDDLDQVMGDVVKGPGRGRPRGRGRGKGRGGWRKLLKGTEHEDIGKSPSRGGGRGRGRGNATKRVRKKKIVDPGAEFKQHLNDANAAMGTGDLDMALDFARLAVQANPEVFHAHLLLSNILNEQGFPEESAEAFHSGAIVERTADTWVSAADRFLECAGDPPELEYVRKAISCLGDALKFEKDRDTIFRIRVRKYDLYKEVGDIKFARLDCKNILHHWPTNLKYLREYAELCGQWQDKFDLERAKEFYDKAFEHFKDDPKLGSSEENPWSHLNIYLELCDLLNQPLLGLTTGRRLARWLLGRKDEAFWDTCADDDREWDFDNTRRQLVGEFQEGRASMDRSKYGDGLPIEIRVKLGLFRVRMGRDNYTEALKHFWPLLDYVEFIDEYFDLFLQVGKALRHAGFVEEPLQFFQHLRSVGDELDENAWMAVATSYYNNFRKEEAIKCFEEVVSIKGENYGRASSYLARLYEDTGAMEKAIFLCNELIKMGRRDLLSNAQIKLITPAPPTSPLKSTPASKLKPRPRLPAHVEAQLSAPEPEDNRVSWNPMISYRQLLPVGGLPATESVAEESVAEEPVAEEPDAPAAKKKRKKRRGTELAIARPKRKPANIAAEDKEEVIERPKLKGKEDKRRTVEQERMRMIEDADARVHANYGVVMELWPSMREGQDQDVMERWIDAARNMLDEFLNMKFFFPDRDRLIKLKIVDDPGKRHGHDYYNAGAAKTREFHNIAFGEWHHIFGDLALLYAGKAEQDKCYQVVKDVMFAANVFFQVPELENASYGVGIYCALVFNDSQYLVELARKLIVRGDFRAGMTYQLFAAISRGTFGSNWFSAGPSQKFMLRAVKTLDYNVLPDEVREKMDWAMQKGSLEGRLAKLDDGKNELDAGVLMIYGHMVAVANHSFSSLPYYFRAFALQPENVCVNLCIATLWVQLSMKRQTENRHLGVNEGLAFLSRYYDLRKRTGRACDLQEAEYNVARMWQYLNLLHLAIPGYEKVLQLSADVQAERLSAMDLDGSPPQEDAAEDFAQEAAFALQGIYSLAGNAAAARAVTEEWLVI